MGRRTRDQDGNPSFSCADFAQMIWIAAAHREDGKRFIVRADEKLTAFVELESPIFAGVLG